MGHNGTDIINHADIVSGDTAEGRAYMSYVVEEFRVVGYSVKIGIGRNPDREYVIGVFINQGVNRLSRDSQFRSVLRCVVSTGSPGGSGSADCVVPGSIYVGVRKYCVLLCMALVF